MSLPTIPATTPTTIAAVPAIVYDKWYLTRFEVSSNNPANPTQLLAVFTKGCVDESGNWTLGDEKARYSVDDLLGLAATDTELATILASVLGKLTALATTAGTI